MKTYRPCGKKLQGSIFVASHYAAVMCCDHSNLMERDLDHD